MTAILGFSELLKQKINDKTLNGYIKHIISSGNILMTLINDILDLSKIESGKLTVNYDLVNLDLFLEELQEIFHQKALDKDLKLITEIAENIPKLIYLDKVRLRQIMFNLISNGIKFTKKGFVKIYISSNNLDSESKIQLKILVKDTGIGISLEKQEEIFNPFMQVDNTRNTRYEGTGLGLTITKRLTGILGGRIELQSEVGKGTIFTVFFPEVKIVSVAPENNKIENLDDDLISTKLGQIPALNILVIDDVSATCELIEQFFQDSKHQVFSAVDGEQGIALARELHPNLILLDLRMPIMSGEEVAKILKSEPQTQDIPIIIFTAHLQEPQPIRDLCEGFLRKPIELSQLITQLEKIYFPEKFPTIPTTPIPNSHSPSDNFLQGTQLSELLDKLMAKKSICQKVCQTMFYDETVDLVNQLNNISNQYNYEPLRNYIHKLEKFIEEFEWQNLSQCLAEFPQIVSDIEQELLKFNKKNDESD